MRMRRYSSKLHFSEDEFSGEQSKASAGKGNKTQRTINAFRKSHAKGSSQSGNKGTHSRKSKNEPGKDSLLQRKASYYGRFASAKAHEQVSRYEDDNVGVQAANTSEEAAEIVGGNVIHRYSRKLRDQSRSSSSDESYSERRNPGSASANSEAASDFSDFEGTSASEHTATESNPRSKRQQKKQIKKEYAASRKDSIGVFSVGKKSGAAENTRKAKKTEKATEESSKFLQALKAYLSEHKLFLVLILLLLIVVVVMAGSFSSCSVLFEGSEGAVLGTSYLASDEDILGANNDYSALEAGLQAEISSCEITHPGYDEYVYNLAQINHNPYELTSLLTVLYGAYTRDEVQSELQHIFNEQYELSYSESTELRTRTVMETVVTVDPETGEETSEEVETTEEYEYTILTVTLLNHGITAALDTAGFTDDQMKYYNVLMSTKGNRPDLFADDIYSNTSSDYLDYDIPGEALTDEKFANMIHEAEKYLGYPYVWGGSSPSTSFDCSGFVCWVINNCGNGWYYPRTDAESLRQQLSIIPASEAQPGDIIFFQGTYDTPGASHVGIYVGNNMMIHCGNPISYADLSSSYWQAHFYCFGRLP